MTQTSLTLEKRLAKLNKDSIALDVETTYNKDNPSKIFFLDDNVRTLQMCDKNGTTLFYDLFNDNIEIEIEIIINFLNECKMLIGHHLTFDLLMLRPLGYETSSDIKIWDTLVAEKVLEKGESKFKKQDNNKLDSVLKRRLDVEISKELQTSDWSGKITKQQKEYALNDVKYLHALMQAQEIELEKEELTRVMELECELIKSLVAMRYNGIRIDVQQIEEVERVIQEKLDDLRTKIEKELKSMTKPLDIKNKSKNKDFKEYLEKEYGIKLKMLNRKNIEPYFKNRPELELVWIMREMDESEWTDEMREFIPQIKIDVINNLGNHHVMLPYLKKYIDVKINSTSKKTLQHYFDKYPLLITICDYNKNQKLKSTLTKQIKEQIVEDRIYPQFLPFGTDTGRFSCKEPNLQGLPRDKRCRNLIIAREGYKLVVCDYSQIELRIAAQVMNEHEFIRAFNNGEDLHVKTAAYVLDKSVEELKALEKSDKIEDKTAFKKARTLAKAVNFGLLYGMGATKFKDYALNNYGVTLTEKQAIKYRDGFLKLYKDIKKAHNEASTNTKDLKMGKSKREVKTIIGRKRILTDRFFTSYLNTPVQGSGGDMTKLAYTYLYKQIKDNDLPYNFVACIHDEIILEVPEQEAVKAAHILQQCMEEAGREIITVVPIIAEPAICDKWGEKDDDRLIAETAKKIKALQNDN